MLGTGKFLFYRVEQLGFSHKGMFEHIPKGNDRGIYEDI